MQKNIASQKFIVFAFDTTTNLPVTGDSANITATISKDFAADSATNDVNPTETQGGFYAFDATQAETNANNIQIFPLSVTANIQVISVPGLITTVPVNFGDDVIQTADHTAGIADIPANAEFNARTILSANYATSASLAVIDDIVDSILIDTSDLQSNQGDWLTATGFNTVVPPSLAQFNARSIVSADYFLVTDYLAPDNAGIAQTQTDISALNDISIASIFAGGDMDGYSLDESLKLILASSVGVLSGAATNSIVIKSADGSKTRLTAAVDIDGNRTSVTKDATG